MTGRFSGFSDLYDESRPSPPASLGPILCRYSATEEPRAVDLGSGTGLSTRWAAGWCSSVVGIEPSADMRRVAESRPLPGVTYRAGSSVVTGQEAGSTDVVLAVQAMHWMEPDATMAEVGRILRPGGVFAVIDADWPPVVGCPRAERAWITFHQRIRALEARLVRGESGRRLLRPVDPGDEDLRHDDLSDPHENRSMPGGVRSWSKRGHLERLAGSGLFSFTRELLFHQPVEGGVDRFLGLMRSQGSYQGLRRLGLSDEQIGMEVFREEVVAGFEEMQPAPALGFCWRVRLAVAAGTRGTSSTLRRA